MSDSVPFLLSEAVVSLYPAAADGQTILAPAIWMGALATRAEISLDYETVKVTASGARYATERQIDQEYIINLQRSWILRRESGDFRPARNQQYVLDFVWSEMHGARGYGRGWYQLTFFGVTGRSVRLGSVGSNHFEQHQIFRAQRVQDAAGVLPWSGGGGESGGDGVYVPLQPLVGVEQPVGWFRESPLVVSEYLLGTYRWPMSVRFGTARLVGWCPQTSVTVLKLEIDGVVTSTAITIPTGPPVTEVAVTTDLSAITIPAGAVVRWKVMSGPSPEDAAWQVALTVGVMPI